MKPQGKESNGLYLWQWSVAVIPHLAAISAAAVAPGLCSVHSILPLSSLLIFGFLQRRKLSPALITQVMGVLYATVWPPLAVFFIAASVVVFAHLESEREYQERRFIVARNAGLWGVWLIAKVTMEGANCAAVFWFCAALAVSCYLPLGSARGEGHSLNAAKWEKLMRASLDGVIVISAALEVAACNAHAHVLLSAPTLSEVKSALIFYPKIRQQSLLQGISEMIKARSSYQTRVEIEDRTVEFRGTVVDGEALVVLRDMTKWATLETTAQQEVQRRQALLRSVSHELKTPTNAIVNICEELKDTASLSPKDQLTFKILSSSSKFLLSTIKDLLDCSLICSRRFQIRKAPFRLEDTIKECVSMVEAQCRVKDLSLVLRYDHQLPAVAHSDQWRVRQVLLNLLSNSLKFTSKGSIEVVAISASRDRIKITVKDTGIGLEPETKQRLRRLLTANGDEAVKSCALGLSVANAIATALSDHAIEFKSVAGCGSEFSFEVAIKESDSFAERPGGHLDESCNLVEEELYERRVPYFRSSHEQAHILVVDDNELNRSVLFRLLESNGYKCHQTFSGYMAIAAVRRHLRNGRTYKVVLMDIDSSETESMHTAHELRDLVLKGELQRLPAVVACSERAHCEDKCTHAGIAHYLEKPISRDALLRLMSKLVPLECRLEE